MARLIVARSYTALTGDLLVVFNQHDDDDDDDDNAAGVDQTDWHVDIVDARHPSPALTTLDVPARYSDAELVVACGVIDVAGQLLVRLVDSTTSDVLAQSGVVDVAWPPVTLRLPHTSTALSDDVRLTLSVDQRVCQSQQQPRASYTLQLLYVAHPGLLNASYTLQLLYVARPGLLNASSSVVYSRTLTTLGSSHVDVPCALVDRAGSYQGVLTSSRRADSPLAVSNVLVVSWSRRYSLSLQSPPCHHQQVVVRHSQPRCAHVFYTLRLLARRAPAGGGDVTRSRDWRYVSERRVKSSRTSVAFDCQDLAATMYDDGELCALLMSTAADNSQHVQRRFCTTPHLPAAPDQSCLTPLLHHATPTCRTRSVSSLFLETMSMCLFCTVSEV